MNSISLTNYDLDGATSFIFLNRKYNFKKVFACGYGKLDANIKKAINYSKNNDIEQIVISDWSLTLDQYKHIERNFKNIVYIDHHETSKEVCDYLGIDLNIKLCAGVQCAKHIQQPLSKNDKILLSACNDYDNWKTKNKFFTLGQDLTELFFKMNLWNFVKRFANGFDEFTESELSFLHTVKEKKKKAFDELIYDWSDDENELLVFLKDGIITNDITLKFDAKFYWIVSVDENGFKMSARTTTDFNLGLYFEHLSKKYPDKIHLAGGHKQAAGMSFLIDTENEVFDFITLCVLKEKENFNE